MAISMKAARLERVDPETARKLYTESRTMAHPMLCPAGATHIAHDEYGRPAIQTTLPIGKDASCAMGSSQPINRVLARENYERPYTPIADPGLMGSGDMAAWGRNRMPQNLYGNGYGGNFVRHYPTQANRQADEPSTCQQTYPGYPREYDGSMGATRSHQRQ
jgi:hypothetical protein